MEHEISTIMDTRGVTGTASFIVASMISALLEREANVPYWDAQYPDLRFAFVAEE